MRWPCCRWRLSQSLRVTGTLRSSAAGGPASPCVLTACTDLSALLLEFPAWNVQQLLAGYLDWKTERKLMGVAFYVPASAWSACLFLITYLFIFGSAGSSLLHRLLPGCCETRLLSSCGVQASHCDGFSCCWAWAVGCMGFSSCGTHAPEYRFSSCGSQA